MSTTGDRWARSRRLLEESRGYLASGVASTLRLAVRPTPLFVDHGAGSRVVDVDGNEYIDYTMAYGPLILGHAHPAVVQAVSEAARRGVTFGAQHRDEIAVARQICEQVPGAELVCFSGSGTEAVMLALRLARAFTGRSKVIRFAGHYHGWSDGIFTTAATVAPDAPAPGTAGQSSNALEDVIVVPWNDLAAVEAALHGKGGDVAAVICEPVLCNSGCIEPLPGYLEGLRLLSTEYGSVLIFDEVITGFRLGPGGAQERFGVQADLATFGKALAGGLGLSAVAGRGDILDLVASGVVAHLGTLNGNTLALAAARATLAELGRDEAAPYPRMATFGDQLAAGFAAIAEEAAVPLVVNSVGQAFQTIFTTESAVDDYATFAASNLTRCAEFVEAMLHQGVYVRPNGLWYLSTAHTEQDVATTLDAAARAFSSLAASAPVELETTT